jgi:hypothetical protein
MDFYGFLGMKINQNLNSLIAHKFISFLTLDSNHINLLPILHKIIIVTEIGRNTYLKQSIA